MTPYLRALGLTVAVEVPTVALFYPGQRLRLGLVCCVVTTLTHAALFLGLPVFVALTTWVVLAGEVGVVMVEALAYALLSRPRGAPRALMASSLANGLSFGLGLALL